MGMGYGANYADVVDEAFVKETCPDELQKFREAFETYQNDPDLSESASYLISEVLDTPESPKTDSPTLPMWETYHVLIEKFAQLTGLYLALCYHDSDSEGDRYDDVNGEFWSVGGVYTITPAGEKFKDKISRVHYVTFG